MPSPTKSIKRFVIDGSTGKFLAQGGGWTVDEAEALNFDGILEVIAACAKEQIPDAQVLLRFAGPPAYDMRLPLRHHAPPQRVDDVRSQRANF